MLDPDCTPRRVICRVDGCDHVADRPNAHLCEAHYYRLRRTGSVEAHKPVKRWNRTDAERLWCKVDKSGGPNACWPWAGYRNKRGYGPVSGVNRRRTTAHRLAWELTYGPIPPGLFVCHSCDNPPCCNPAHLWLGTHDDNMADRSVKGRVPHGEQSKMAVLTVTAVREIRSRYAAGGISQRALAKEYGVSRRAIVFVVQGKTWKRV